MGEKKLQLLEQNQNLSRQRQVRKEKPTTYH